MENDRILLLENLYGTLWLILEDNSRVLLDDYDAGTEHFYSPKIQDFNNYINLLGNISVPYMMFNNTFESPQMNSIKYDASTIDFLNTNGLHIFLTENLMKYDSDRFYHSRQDKANFQKVNNDSGLNLGVFNNPRCGQLDSVQDLINNNQLTNVTVYTSEHNVADAFIRYPNIKFKWKDLYLQQFIKDNANIPLCKKNKIEYTFINTNWRYEPFRHVVAAYLKNYNSKISWSYSATQEVFEKNMWFKPDEKLLEGFCKLNNSIPLNIDISIQEPTVLEGNILDRFKLPKYEKMPTILTNYYSNVFCNVITESSYLDITTYISDKTCTAILNCMPFIIAGPPQALKTAKTMGFKTFDKYWDESYDDEFDHTKRMKMLFEVIDYVASLPQTELTNIRDDMQELLIYNRQHINQMVL